MFGNYSLPTHLRTNFTENETVESTTPEDPKWMRVNMILGGDPFITFETPYIEDLNEFKDYMALYYPEITMTQTVNRRGQTIIIGVA